jgi:hypothetical protein
MPSSKTISVRLSVEQLELLRVMLGVESDSDYVRRLIAQDMKRRGLYWPDYEWVTNEDRQAEKQRKLNQKT